MSAEPAPAPWPWPRLLLLSLGSGLAMVGTYIIMFRLFELGFELSSNHSREPFFWGGLALVAGIVMLGAPWFPNAPWWKHEE